MNQKADNITQEKKKPDPFYMSLTLVIGPWKRLFSTDEIEVIIAEALNYPGKPLKYEDDPCVKKYKHHHKKNRLNIAGYLITERRVCLVLKVEPEDLDRQIDIFSCHVWYEIKEQLKHRKNKPHESKILEEIVPETLFRKTPLVNQELIQMLIGRELFMLYNTSSLNRMKASLSKSQYCSVIDYSGAVGPVFVKKLDCPKEYHKKNHEEHEKDYEKDPLRHPVIHPYGVIDYLSPYFEA